MICRAVIQTPVFLCRKGFGCALVCRACCCHSPIFRAQFLLAHAEMGLGGLTGTAPSASFMPCVGNARFSHAFYGHGRNQALACVPKREDPVGVQCVCCQLTVMSAGYYFGSSIDKKGWLVRSSHIATGRLLCRRPPHTRWLLP